MGVVSAPYIPTKGTGPYTFVPPNWADGYRAAVARNAANGGPVRVWFHGNSEMQGFKGTNNATDGYRWLVRNGLISKIQGGRSADYFPVTHSQHFLDMGSSGIGSGASNGFTMTTPPWLLATAPATSAPLGFCFGNTRYGYVSGSLFVQNFSYSGMGGDAAWFNGPAAGTTIATFQHSVATHIGNAAAYDVVVPNFSAGTVHSYNVNGAGANNIVVGSANNRNQIIQMATGLTPGAYDTVFKTVTGIATGTAWIGGVTVHAGARGAQGVQCAHLTANSACFSNYDDKYVDSTLLGRDATSGVVGSGGFPMCPDLIICNMVFGDSALYGAELSRNRLATAIQGWRRGRPGCSIMLLVDHHQDGLTADGADPIGYAQGWPSYISRVYDVAMQYNCSVLNIHSAWSGLAVTNGLIAADNIHYTTPGHLDIANRILAMIP